MEHLIYLTVKGLTVFYLLHKIYRFLSEKRARDFWRFLTPENTVKEKIIVPSPATVHYDNVAGKSRTVYLEEPPNEKAVEPVFSEDLEQEAIDEAEPDTTAGDVDDNLNKEIPPEEERFIPLDAEPDGEAVSIGMTYEQISEALDVVQGKKTDNASKITAARILYEVEGSDLFNFLSAQAENEEIVERLLKENIDNVGVSLPENKRKRTSKADEFDMGKYV
jgi:hypothetical protein